METNKIAELLAIVEELLATIKDPNTEKNEKMLLGWKVLSHLTQVYGIVNSCNVRAPGQLLVARLILKESNRMIDETVKSIDSIPEEFNMMISSIKSTGQNDNQETVGL